MKCYSLSSKGGPTRVDPNLFLLEYFDIDRKMMILQYWPTSNVDQNIGQQWDDFFVHSLLMFCFHDHKTSPHFVQSVTKYFWKNEFS